MAKFPGPRSFLLVLAGLVLCLDSVIIQAAPATDSPMTGSPSRTPNRTLNETATTIHTTGFPPNTTMQQHHSNTTLNKKVTDINTTGFPPNTTMQQHPNSSITMTTADNLNSSTPDPTRNGSTMNTSSPTLMPTTAPDTPVKCNYDLTEGAERFEVNVSAKNYTINLTDTDGNMIPLQSMSSTIPFKLLKPCRSYNLTVHPDCARQGNGPFKTRSLYASDVTPKINESHVCFETIWALNHCIEISKDNSCTNINLSFQDDSCKTSIPFTLPPVKPVITSENKIPAELHWQDRPQSCNGSFSYNCTDAESTEKVEKLKPNTTYKCTGIYHYGNGTITSDPLTVKITCNISEPSISSKTHNSIEVSWDKSRNCQGLEFVAEVKNDKGQREKTAKINDKSTHNFTPLDPFKSYTLIFTAKYEMQVIFSREKPTETLSSEPTIQMFKVERAEHNAFKVTCNLESRSWNGLKGHFYAKVYQPHEKKNIPVSSKECDFKFKDLYYSTEYTIEVYAINGNGNQSKSHTEKHWTKYNDKAVLGFLSFLIILTSVALLFVLYKIYLLKKKKSRNEQEMDDLLPPTPLYQVEPMSAEALLEAYKEKRADEGRLFMDEFQSVPRIYSNYTIREAKKTENQSKNRYVDILPYDYNRVPLSHGGTGDYINASFIEGYKETNKYIAAQGPKEETVGDFWMMIWEQNTSIIVMVTRCEEGNKNKCAQYWPSLERETEIFDDLVVKIKGEEKCPNYIIRHLTLMNRKEKAAEREVTHIQFTSWPDHGVPTDPGLLLKLRRRVNSFKNFFSGPIVVHCSAGVGRTGTYICIDAMIESLEAEGRVDIYGYVVKLRRQRCLMVQVEAQYVLIHTALIEYSQFGETEMSLSNFHSEVNTLRQKEGNELSLIEEEFQKLPKFRNYRSSNTARTEENKKKNRTSIVPYDFNRVPVKVEDEASHDSEAEDEDEYSSDEDDEVPTKYVNASYVDGYWYPRSIIAAQGPMADTVPDFLHMLDQKQVKAVFMLSNCTEDDKEFCSQYWDDDNKKTFGEMVVEVKETENTPTYIRRCLEIQHTKRKDSHTLQQYHFLKWAGHELPAKPIDLIDMIKSVRQSSENRSSNVPILAHCNDGSTRSGIFCALWKLLDSADTEKLVDIFQVAKDLRKARPGMINTLEQYEFLYAALEAAFPVQNGEVKKPSEAPADSVQVVNESTALISPNTDAAAKESTKEGSDSASPEEGATEASSEPEKGLSESTTNGPTVTVEV
ncbi:receptor-type tyrosine-protein phosphatase C isoform X4 [Neoarius graeffei]|uniref:receptor-type tyrosine-protein phosphatase C isoform X4 n=1 Tax=Neoarius graeffei TaxID=443677 RepID=UPI00298C49D4|nr:receptor-type tyrosine-protein phosphatase C isoform X4 [Neoarius graeffei]